MAVIRDVNLDTTNENLTFIGTIGGLLCLVVAVLGIKLKWFKHRMTFNDLPTTTISPSQSNGIEPQIIRATFRPSADFDNYVEVTPPKVLPPVRIHKSTRNTISLPPRKRQAPNVPTLSVSHIDTNSNEIEPLQSNGPSEQVFSNLIVDERRQSTPPPPLPTSQPPIDNQESPLLSLETNNNSNHQQEETEIQLQDIQDANETILPLPPPYQVNDPLAHNHYKKFTQKKISSTPLHPPHKLEIISLEQEINESPKVTTKSFNTSPSPRDAKLDKKQSFLHQVATPTELPKLAFDFPSTSLPNLMEPSSESLLQSTQSTHSLTADQPKPNEKKGLFGYFTMKLGNKSENDTNKIKNEKMESAPIEAKIEKRKVTKIRVLKTEKKEKLPRVKVNKNERAAVNRKPDETIEKTEQSMADANISIVEIMENKMEIDYFQKVKKPKPNRIPIIVKSPKAEGRSEEKPAKSEVFRHEETFSAANGPIKIKKKKNKPNQGDAGIEFASPDENVCNVAIKIKQSSPKLNEAAPIPKPRVILNLDGFDDDNREIELENKTKRNVRTPVLSSPSSPSDSELDTWNLVAQHRLNTRAITAAAISVRQKSDSDGTTNSSMLQMKQIDILNKPKTMREMKREQEEQKAKAINFGGKDDKESDTEA